ncbi:MAG: 30S ribosomal protein S11 [Patescibacteria group bacterium]|nr:30S ribosomal protein S11 [Patescibacteria group bacterium]MDE2116813.1 30S ribosomal protein S11 [Patescibacteria group bacterium]
MPEATTKPANATPAAKAAPKVAAPKRKVDFGMLFVQSTYNNTLCLLADSEGNALAQSSAGALGFKGAKKGTPFAAAKVGEVLADKAKLMGVKEVSVVIKGVGSGRESAVRSFITKGIGISSVKDVTPVPHNGPRPPRARRV